MTSEQRLGPSPAQLTLGTRGVVRGWSYSLGPGGGVEARVEEYDVAGALSTLGHVPLPFSGTFGLLQTNGVATHDSMAVVAQRQVQVPGLDGGLVAAFVPEVRQLFFDGGVVGTLMPEPPTGLLPVNESVVVEFTSFDSSGVRRWLRALSKQGVLGATRLEVPEGGALSVGADALAVFPGPTLYSEALAPASTPPSPPFSSGLTTWRVGDDSVSNVSLDDEGNVLVNTFALGGQRLGVEHRVSSGVAVHAVARSAHGVGIIFSDTEWLDDGGTSQPTWFAFIDDTGRKRGPDVPLSPTSQPSLLLGSPVDDRFGLFLRGNELTHALVTCE